MPGPDSLIPDRGAHLKQRPPHPGALDAADIRPGVRVTLHSEHARGHEHPLTALVWSKPTPSTFGMRVELLLHPERYTVEQLAAGRPPGSTIRIMSFGDMGVATYTSGIWSQTNYTTLTPETSAVPQ